MFSYWSLVEIIQKYWHGKYENDNTIKFKCYCTNSSSNMIHLYCPHLSYHMCIIIGICFKDLSFTIKYATFTNFHISYTYIQVYTVYHLLILSSYFLKISKPIFYDKNLFRWMVIPTISMLMKKKLEFFLALLQPVTK